MLSERVRILLNSHRASRKACYVQVVGGDSLLTWLYGAMGATSALSRIQRSGEGSDPLIRLSAGFNIDGGSRNAQILGIEPTWMPRANCHD